MRHPQRASFFFFFFYISSCWFGAHAVNIRVRGLLGLQLHNTSAGHDVDLTGVSPPAVIALQGAHRESVPTISEEHILLKGQFVAGLLVFLLLPASYYSCNLWRQRFSSGQVRFQVGDMSREQRWATGALVLYVVLLIANDMLSSRTAQRHHGKYPWEPAIVVLLVEACKLLASLPLWLYRLASASSSDEEGVTAASKVGDEAGESKWSAACAAFMRLVPVALLYSTNNCLVLFVLSYVQLHSFVVWRNTAIFFNALLWTYALGRQLGHHQWLAVGFMCIGCSLNSIRADGSWSSVLGYPALLLLLSALMSATAAAFNEAVLKTERFARLGADVINIMLYSQTSSFLAIFLLGRAVHHERSMVGEFPRLLGQLDGSAFAIIAMLTMLGLTVSRVLLHASAVAKTMAGGAREILEMSIAPLFVTSRLDWTSMPSAVWISLAMVTYFAPSGAKK
eukprot:TRINITY_DN32989_c0_g1_i1.p1 TRINITY_DN32989_c0_g1~~TRINITY_DN32989_c0_g1_i1.p1  ORF type:complete len:452 (-),score=74.29 TRINITY_DN32989_c0_g1_i1:336-1691(-)